MNSFSGLVPQLSITGAATLHKREQMNLRVVDLGEDDDSSETLRRSDAIVRGGVADVVIVRFRGADDPWNVYAELICGAMDTAQAILHTLPASRNPESFFLSQRRPPRLQAMALDGGQDILDFLGTAFGVQDVVGFS